MVQAFQRLIKILYVFSKYRLDELAEPQKIPFWLRCAIRINPLRLRLNSSVPDALEARLRLAMEELGPVFVKFGQAMSTRRDLLSPLMADELAKLQDHVTPFNGDTAKAIVAKDLDDDFDRVFTDFDTTPIASASIAQVHAATLHNHKAVVVKVVRPGIRALIENDIALMYSLANFAQRFIPDSRRLRPLELVKEYEVTIIDELDMAREAANQSQLRRNFIDTDLLYVPEVYFDYVGENFMVQERIHGIPIGNRNALVDAGINLKVLSERGVEIFFTQVFRDNFFHADMHPGNIFVATDTPDKPKYIGIDCAIIGSLSDFDRYYLARNLLAIFKRDYHAVAKLHVECGWVPKSTRIADFEGAIRAACEPIFEKPISEIGFAQILLYLFKVARRFNMEVQPSMVLLQKTLVNVEGLGRDLYPDLNLWDTAMPFLERYMKERYSLKMIYKQLKEQAPAWLEQLPELPNKIIYQLNQDQTTNTDDLPPKPRVSNSHARLAWFSVVAIVAILLNKPELVEPQLNEALRPIGYIGLGMAIVMMLK